MMVTFTVLASDKSVPVRIEADSFDVMYDGHLVFTSHNVMTSAFPPGRWWQVAVVEGEQSPRPPMRESMVRAIESDRDIANLSRKQAEGALAEAYHLVTGRRAPDWSPQFGYIEALGAIRNKVLDV